MPQRSRIPRGGGRLPSARGGLVIDEVRGSIRVRAWPKARGQNRNPTNVFWTNWLKGVTYLYRYQPAIVQWQMQEATKGTVWMPRDVFISAARGRAWLLQDEFGRTWYPRAMVQDVSNSLDAINQTPGGMLYRGTDLWVPVPGGSAGQYLQYVDDANPPIWFSPPSTTYTQVLPIPRPASAVVFNVNSTTYIAWSQTTHWLDFDVMAWSEFRISISAQSNAAGQTISLQLCKQGAPTTPVSSGGNDLVIDTTFGPWISDWIPMSLSMSGLERLQLAFKGSNATVDINSFEVQIHYR